MIQPKARLYSEFARFISLVRTHFLARNFVETPTPTLVSCPGMEAHLDPIATESGAFLPTSPEIHLKRLLCMGFEQIFEIRPCFRNDPATPLHAKEFMMIEWYRAGAQAEDLARDLRELFRFLSTKNLWPHPLELKEVTFQGLFREFFDFSFRPETSRAELAGLFKGRGLHFTAEDSKEDLIHRALIDTFEPSFQGLTVLKDFPPEMAVLSRIGANGFAQRFELFFNSMELANAFHEVTDPTVQRARWEKDVEDRHRLGVRTLRPDQNLLNDMENQGLPPCAGIALGLNRLFMAAKGVEKIEDLNPF